MKNLLSEINKELDDILMEDKSMDKLNKVAKKMVNSILTALEIKKRMEEDR